MLVPRVKKGNATALLAREDVPKDGLDESNVHKGHRAEETQLDHVW